MTVLLISLTMSAFAQTKTDTKPQKAPAPNCAITPDLCMKEPIARGCGTGRHWSKVVIGMALCVEDDMTCEEGKKLIHDLLGNPSCVVDETAEKDVDAKSETKKSLNE